LEGIASVTEAVDLTFNKLLAFNIGYNFLAHCTSISTNRDPNNSQEHPDNDDDGPFHLRNMDWDLEVAEGLCDITIDVDFQKEGVNLFRITTWVGMIGCLTGMRYSNEFTPNSGWSISLNYRKTDESFGMLKNITAGMFKYHGIEFLMRTALQTEATFDTAVNRLSTENIMAPCYLTMAGPKQNEGILITRKRRGEVKRLKLNVCPETENQSKRFIIQTNICHWKDKVDPNWAGSDLLLQNALERREVATKNMLSYKKATSDGEAGGSTSEALVKENDHFVQFAFNVMSQYPTCNAETIYQNVMRPASNFYQTRIVHNPPSSYNAEIADESIQLNVA